MLYQDMYLWYIDFNYFLVYTDKYSKEELNGIFKIDWYSDNSIRFYF